MLCHILTLFVFVHVTKSNDFYKIPAPTFESFKPKGFRMTIPNEDGVEMVAFFVNFNKELTDTNGEYTKYIVQPTNNLWIYENKILRLKKNDKIYVKILVLKNEVQYVDDSVGPFIVTDLVNKTSIHVMQDHTSSKTNCQESLQNISKTSLDLEEQLINTKEDNVILKEIASREPSIIKINGAIAQGYTTKENLESLLNQKLGLRDIKIKSASKHLNYVEVTLLNIDDKLRFIKSVRRYLGGQSQQINVIYY